MFSLTKCFLCLNLTRAHKYSAVTREKQKIHSKENMLLTWVVTIHHNVTNKLTMRLMALQIINVGFCAYCKCQNMLLKILFNDSLTVINTKELLDKLTQMTAF